MRPQRIAGLLIASGGLHALLLLSIQGPGPTRPIRSSEPIRIRMTEAPSAPPVKTPDTGKPPTSVLSEKKSVKKNTSPTPRPGLSAPDEARVKPVPDYRSLVAGPSSFMVSELSTPDSHAEQSLLESLGSGKKAADAWLSGEKLAGKLQIPYEYQRVAEEGFAKASVALTDQATGQSLKLNALTGSPALRAVLFNAIKSPVNQKEIIRLMKLLKRDTFMIRLNFRQESSLSRGGNNFTRLTETRSASLTVTLIHHNRESSTIIPDQFVEKEKRWEPIRLAKLRESPAFRRPLFDITL